MPIIQTPKELGLAIRSRRKDLGWDQVSLAKQVGVTRQWVIDIEKGKPRAELGLALRALRVLGLSLNVEHSQEEGIAKEGAKASQETSDTPSLDINAIVDRNRGGAASHFASHGSVADYLKQLEAARELQNLASLRSAADTIGAGKLTSQLSELVNLKFPQTVADYLKQLRAGGSLAPPANLDEIRRNIDPLADAIASGRLNDALPKTLADELRELEKSGRIGLGKMTASKLPRSKKP